MAHYVAVDWGTTSFRLWLLGTDGAILGESRSREGMTTALSFTRERRCTLKESFRFV